MMTTILTKPNLNLANVQIAAGITQDAIHAAPRTKINILSFLLFHFHCSLSRKMVGGFNRWRLLYFKPLIMSGKIGISISEFLSCTRTACHYLLST